jgi:hypothetical protein
MPVLNGPLAPHGEAVVAVEVAVPFAFARFILSRGLTPAAPVTVHAVIDTGSFITCIDPGVFLALRLAPFTTMPIQTASSGQAPVDRDVYRVNWTVLHPGRKPPLALPRLTVVATDLSQTGHEAVLGCDVLARCKFTYNGRAGTFSLAY